MNEFKPQTDDSSEEQAANADGEPPESIFRVSVTDQQSTLTLESSQLQAAVLAVIRDSPYKTGTVSVAVVDDPTIHEINRQYLEHDYPTDVLSFVLEDRPPYLEGELVVSTDTAKSNAAEYNWSAVDELLLYVIHGALHLVGYRDKQPGEITAMRAAEAKYLLESGIALPTGDNRWQTEMSPIATNEARPS